MSRIEEMLRELCPEGVEYWSLGEVVDYSKSKVSASNLDESSFVGVDNLKANCGGRVDAQHGPNTEALTEFQPNDVLLGNIRPYLKKAWLSDRMGGASGDVLVLRIRGEFEDAIIPDFLYYIISSDSFFRYDQQHARGGKMPRGDKMKILEYRIPVPPLGIQREIVDILDSFTRLKAELEAELEARKAQYAFYRDHLLNFESVREGGRTSVLGLPPFEVRWATLGEVGCFYGGLTGKSKADFGASGSRFVSYKNVFENSATRLDCESFVKIEPGEKQNALHYGDVLFTGSSENREEAGMSSVLLEDPGEETFLNSFCICYRWSVLSEVEPAFYRHLFRARSVRVAISKTAMGVTRFNLSKAELKKISIPIPPLDVQRRIADVLDSFDALVNDLSSGLPAEIAARRTQYEHYRDRLLTFPEKKK